MNGPRASRFWQLLDVQLQAGHARDKGFFFIFFLKRSAFGISDPGLESQFSYSWDEIASPAADRGPGRVVAL
jgi:hypothetical protein